MLGFKSRDLMLKFAAEVIDTVMAPLAAHCSIIYGVYHGDRWYQVHRDTDAPKCAALFRFTFGVAGLSGSIGKQSGVPMLWHLHS